MQSPLIFALVLVGTSALTAIAVLLLASVFRQPRGSGHETVRETLDDAGDAVFLFEDRLLIDTNKAGAALLESLERLDIDAPEDDWTRLTRFLAQYFSDLDARLGAATRAGEHMLEGSGDMALSVQRRDGNLRLSVIDTKAEGGSIRLDRLSYRAMREELSALRRITEAAPLLMWRENADRQVIWANGAYLQHANHGGTQNLTWPLPALFSGADHGKHQCLSVTGPGGQQAESWYRLAHVATGSDLLSYALPADEARKAERTKREFIQTLTKTFATLPIGLAVFDRARRLQIFNPALADLTGLETEFLLSRPGIEGFLNRMRDKHILPEPRDFRAWRKRLLDIESVGPSGEFEETWTMPTGQTFRFSANPHPDGALALLIEDITSETHLTRNVRAEVETSHAVLNQLDTALAVFSPGGQLMLTNTAFSRLWTLEGEDTLAGVTLAEALAIWREAGDDPALWLRIAALTRHGTPEPGPVCGVMRLSDAGCLHVEARRTSNGAIIIAFSQDAPAETHQQGPAPAPRRAQILRASA